MLAHAHIHSPTMAMKGVDVAGYNALRKCCDSVCNSSLNPSDLARKLLVEGLIGESDKEAAGQTYLLKANRLDALLTAVMASGAPGAFQTFVEIVKKNKEHEWLAKELIGKLLG